MRDQSPDLGTLTPAELEQLLRSDLSDEARTVLVDWCARQDEPYDALRVLARALSESFHPIGATPDEIRRHADAILHRAPGVHATRERGAPLERQVVRHAEPQFFSRPLFGVAIAAVLLCAIGVTALWHRTVSHASSISRSTTTYATANGERANITLPDGSMAMLNVASRLEVPGDYAAGNHTVRLTGEALFTVTHHTGTPFTVTSGPLTTRVLGTSFLVRHYATDTTTQVAVRDGKVAVRSIVLPASRQFSMDGHGAIRVQPADPSQFSFATGTLVLNGVTLADAIPELDRWYDADIRVGDAALGTRRLTVECAAGSLADLAAILEWTFNMRVVRHGRMLTLYQKP